MADKVEDVQAGVQALAVSDKPAKVGLGESEYAKDLLEKLAPEIREKVHDLYAIQQLHDELEQQYLKERFELEAKYQRKYEPLNKERSARVRGAAVEHYVTKEGDTFAAAATAAGVSAEQLQADNPDLQDPLPAGVKLVVVKGPSDAAKGIPQFWLNCLTNHPLVSEVITEKDAKILEFLEDITQKTLPDDKGFTLEFYFGKNTYFSNEVLTKTFHVDKDGSGMFDLEKDEGTAINWASDSVNPTQKTMRRKPKPGQKPGKMETKVVPDNSFFNLFKTKITGDVSEDDPEVEELMEQLEQDYSIGAVIREEILPRAVAWFTGEAAEDYDDYDGEDEDEEGEDDEDEDDEDDEDGGAPRPARKGQKGGRGAGGPGGDAPNPECKQQ